MEGALQQGNGPSEADDSREGLNRDLEDVGLGEAAVLTVLFLAIDTLLRKTIQFLNQTLPDVLDPILYILIPIRLLTAFLTFAAFLLTLALVLGFFQPVWQQ